MAGASPVARTQIPGFLKGFDIYISLADVTTDESLLHKLDESLLDRVCEIFAVRREWLDGVDDQVHPCHDFYKNPEGFAQFIRNLKVENPNGDLDGTLIAPDEFKDANALIILQETIGLVGDKPIYRFHICHNWLFSYWKARAYLTACTAIAWKLRIYIRGVWLPKKEIKLLEEGKTLLGWKGEGHWELGSKTWYAEDLALVPEVFLEGIDPERNNFGINSALQLWLELETKGFMNTGLGKEAKGAFESRLRALGIGPKL